MHQIEFADIGLTSYKEAWDFQDVLFREILNIKTENKRHSLNQKTPNYLLFTEHRHVYTLGKSGDPKNLLIDDDEMKKQKIEYFKTNRGGDITYHGAGQIVGYPILDLENFFTDIKKYMRFLEEVIINTCLEYGLEAKRIEGLTGVWLSDTDGSNPRKICAMGVKSSRWVTMHGWAFNINTDLTYFNHIIPCGIDDKAVTSLAEELESKQDIEEVKKRLKRNFEQIFEAILKEKTDELLSRYHEQIT